MLGIMFVCGNVGNTVIVGLGIKYWKRCHWLCSFYSSLFSISDSISYPILALPCRRLGWETKPGESHLDAMSRGEILNALAVFGHDLTLDEASKRFQAFLKQKYTTSST